MCGGERERGGGRKGEGEGKKSGWGEMEKGGVGEKGRKNESWRGLGWSGRGKEREEGRKETDRQREGDKEIDDSFRDITSILSCNVIVCSQEWRCVGVETHTQHTQSWDIVEAINSRKEWGVCVRDRLSAC